MLKSRSTRAVTEAGFADEQAEALSEMLTEIFSAFATKQDLALSEERTGRRIEVLASELRGEMSTLRAEMSGEMSSLRTELRSEMSALESRLGMAIEKSAKEQTWKFVALVAFISTVLGIINYIAA